MQVTRAIGLDAVATHRIHHQHYFGLGSDVGLQVDSETSGCRGFLNFLDASESQQPLHLFGKMVINRSSHSVDSHHRLFLLLPVAECDEIILIGHLSIAKDKGELAVLNGFHVHSYPHLARLASNNCRAITINGAIPIRIHLRGYIID